MLKRCLGDQAVVGRTYGDALAAAVKIQASRGDRTPDRVPREIDRLRLEVASVFEKLLLIRSALEDLLQDGR